MDGIIVIDKQKGCTSHDVVKTVKKITNTQKVGHTGTLDPNATGVLPILLGKATKLSKYLMNHDKTYQVVLTLGEKRDTADIEGVVIDKQEVNEEILKKENIEKILNSFLGEQMQTPPIYSAIKVKGKKLYEYARAGKEITIEPRKITIYAIQFLSQNQKEIQFRVSCSKGTYIRSLCEEIAAKLQTVGYMKELRREQVGEFTLESAVKIEELEEHENDEDFLRQHVISIEQFYQEKEKIILSSKEITYFLNGVQLKMDKKEEIYRIYDQSNHFIGLGTVTEHRLKRDIV